VKLMNEETQIDIKGLNLWYGENQALHDVSMPVYKNKITALIGPSGCGKSTLLRTINRMNDIIDSCRIQGEICYNGNDIYAPACNVMSVRKRIGMIFQKPNPFPMSIYDNITYGPKIHGTRKKEDLDCIVEDCLRQAVLWDEVKDRLEDSAMGLSAGCLTLAFLILPVLIRTTEEAVKTVPHELKEASLALGASKWETVVKVILPTAFPGIITGSILAIGRAAGETAPIMFTAVVAYQTRMGSSILDPVMALPYHLYYLATNVPNAQDQQYGTAVVLLLIVMSIFLAASILRQHYSKKFKW